MPTQSQRRYQAEKKAAKYVARFKAVVEHCDVCGRWNDGSHEVHEIPRGNYWRLIARGKPFACLLLCGGFRVCHLRMGGMPRAKQLAYVYLAGRLRMEFYNRLFRPMVPVEDVMREVKRLLESERDR